MEIARFNLNPNLKHQLTSENITKSNINKIEHLSKLIEKTKARID